MDRRFTTSDASRILNQVMVNLGFENGYVAQGGDVGSRIARTLGTNYDSCKGECYNELLTEEQNATLLTILNQLFTVSRLFTSVIMAMPNFTPIPALNQT